MFLSCVLSVVEGREGVRDEDRRRSDAVAAILDAQRLLSDLEWLFGLRGRRSIGTRTRIASRARRRHQSQTRQHGHKLGSADLPQRTQSVSSTQTQSFSPVARD